MHNDINYELFKLILAQTKRCFPLVLCSVFFNLRMKQKMVQQIHRKTVSVDKLDENLHSKQNVCLQ